MSESLKIAINCELSPGTQAGGTQSVVSGLVRALATLDGNEHYQLICHPENRGWVEPFIQANIQLVDRPQPPDRGWRGAVQNAAARFIRDLTGEAAQKRWPEVGRSDGFYESLGAKVIHWPWQHFVVTGLPSVFNPHDLLHLHYPQFFQPREIIAREALYPVACRLAHTVVAGSQWARNDFVSRYGLDSKRVQIIPWAPPTAAGALPETAVQQAREKFSLPQAFGFFPAVTWEHKNHLRLLEAIAALRDRGTVVNFICTGHQHERHWPKVEATWKRLELTRQVQFLGRVSFTELRAIYRAAQFVFVPTLFEAASGPVFEAWQEDVPVACSTITSLPQQVGDAALLFNPYKTDAIASALHAMATDSSRREILRANGRRRLQDFPWERTARAYRAVYRNAAGVPLTSEEKELLQWDWMSESRANHE